MPAASFISAPHKEAVGLIKFRRPVASKVFYGMLPELRGRAFTVSGLAGAAVLQRVRDAVAAVPQGPEGMTWDQAKREIADELEKAHFSEEAAAARANLILRVNTFQAYSASIWRVAMEDEDTTHLQYIHGDQAKDPTPEHEALDGIVLPKDDPFWNTHTGPWGHIGCVCYVRPMNPDLVDEERARDAGRNPEDRNVLEGAVRTHLNQGEIIRKGRRYNVSPPTDPGAFRWHPDDLRLSLKALQSRYDPPEWEAFERWSKNTVIEPDVSVWDWLAETKPLPKITKRIQKLQPTAVSPAPAPTPKQRPKKLPPTYAKINSAMDKFAATKSRLQAGMLELDARESEIVRERGEIRRQFPSIADRPQRYAKLTEELEAINGQRQAIARRREKLKIAALKVIEIPSDDRGTLSVIAAGAGPGAMAKAKQGADVVARFVKKEYVEAGTVKIKTLKGRRAFCGWDQTVNIKEATSVSVTAHELVHALEMRHADLLKKSAEFLFKRTPGEVAQKLSVLTGDSRYAAREKARKDKWAELGGSHYSGKVYGNGGFDPTGPQDIKSTELLTMGIERLIDDPINFWLQDKGYCEMVLKAFRGL